MEFTTDVQESPAAQTEVVVDVTFTPEVLVDPEVTVEVE